MRKLLALLVLTFMVLPALATIIPSTNAQTVDRPNATEISFTEANGITLAPMSDTDLLEMREEVGTRVDGVDYDVIVDGYHTGLAPPSSASWDRLSGEAFIAQVPESLELSAPASYDMSSALWFPKVGDQGGQGSCAAWAATYYTYGAVEAKDNGWTLSKSGNAAQLLSPAWTYNRVANRPAGGSWMSENFEVIKDWGVSTLASFPYVDTNDVNWGTEAAWRNAPLHRGTSIVFLSINGDPTINAIKNLVSGDQPIAFAIDANEFGSSLPDNIISADEYDSPFTLNHAQTIVGYDDSKVAAGHAGVGAFKVVNSWGSGWGVGGYYWISYDAFKYIMNVGGNELCYITDIADYAPSMLAIWHYNSPPLRVVEHSLMVGNAPSFLDVKTPYWYDDSRNSLPTFIICDITEFRPYYDSGTTKISLEITGGAASIISSFRIESYEGGYSPGSPTQVSAQSLQVPKATPGRLENNFVSNSPIIPSEALDRAGIDVFQPGLTDWVGVDHTFRYGGSALQAGDVGDSSSSVMQINVTGYSGVSFFWKVSSEQSADYLRLYDSTTKKMEISGNVGWTRAWYNFTSGGTHLLKWSYEKSSSTSSLQDGAWIDRLQLLQPDDAYEQNDAAPQASALVAPSNISGLMLLDDDWYKIDLGMGDSLNATARFNGSAGNLDLYLYSADATTLLGTSAHSSGDSESVSLIGALEAGYYYLKVRSPDFDAIGYSLQLERTGGLPDFGTTSGLSLRSGTDSFSAISEANQRIVAFVGSTLNGEITYDFNNSWPSEVVPLVLARSWGDPSSTYLQISANLSAGAGSESATISGLVVPTEPGTYYLILAFRNESSAGFVASATSTSLITPIWGDGNDIASFSDEQIADAQSLGRCTDSWLTNGGWQGVKVPADVIKILVIPEDSTPPITQVSVNGAAGSNGWYNSDLSILLTASDLGSGTNETRYRVDSSSWSDYGGTFLVRGNGQHLLEYYSTDLAGNVEPVKSVQLKIDSRSPISSADLEGTMGLASWYISGVVIDISSVDGVSGVSATYYALDGSGEQVFADDLSVSEEGAHILSYHAVDNAGNIEEVHTLQFNIDTVLPSVEGEPIGIVGQNGWFLSSVDVEIEGSDAASGIESIMYRLDGGIWEIYYPTLEVGGEGEHHVEFYAIDHAGNRADTVSLAFRIDSMLPVAQCNVSGEQGDDGWFVGDVIVNLTAHDDLSGVASLRYSLDGSDWIEYSEDLVIGTEGRHSLEYLAIDQAGNNGTMGSMMLMLDSSAPSSVWHLNGTPGLSGWFVTTLTINATGEDGNGSGINCFQYRMDGGVWENYSNPMAVIGEGIHSMECRAIDVAGNIELAQELEFMIDLVAPESSASVNGSLGGQGWFNGPVQVTITAEDVTSGLLQTFIRVNEGEWSQGSTGQFSDGVYLIEFYSMDVAGNSGPIGNVRIESDLEAPSTVPQVAGEQSENGWFRSNVSLELTAYDRVSGVNFTIYRINGGDWIVYDGIIVFGNDGTTLLEYRSMDLAGNEETLQSHEIKVDRTAPASTALIQGETGVGGWYVSSLRIDISSTDEVSGIASTSYRLDSGAWLGYFDQIVVTNGGAHLLQFHAIDQAGNVELAKEVAFSIDNDTPMVLTQLGGKVFTTKQISFNWTSNDSTSGVGAIELSIDGAPYQMFGGTQRNITIQGLGDGQHSLSIRVTDMAGNKAVKELSFVVDTNPLSPQGPYGPALLIALICMAALVAVLMIRRARRR